MSDRAELEKMLDAHEGVARDLYTRRVEIPPFLAIYRRVDVGATPSMLPFGWSTGLVRQIVLAQTRLRLRVERAEAYVIVFEAWMAVQTGDGPQSGEPGFVMPSARPDRQEVLSLVAAARSGATAGRALFIERGPAGQALGRRIPDSDCFEGDLFDLFKGAGDGDQR